MKKDDKKIIVWAIVALVVGVLLGLLITNLATTGEAKYSLRSRNPEKWTLGRNDSVALKPNTEIRTTDGRLMATVNENNEVKFNTKIGKVTENPDGGVTYDLYDHDGAVGESVVFVFQCICISRNCDDYESSCFRVTNNTGYYSCNPMDCCDGCSASFTIFGGNVSVVWFGGDYD
ncbi:MAG TPA: hypothetical protein P5530_02430 [Candidatus Diapherotrites archaeon]|nr:hypothetical protein [Candidatus Diapherotrites archaeon]